MSDDPQRIENHPYFKWRSDGSIQVTLGLAATAIVLAIAGADTISAVAHAGTDHRVHLLLLAAAGLLGGAVVFQYRFIVLALRPLCACAIVLAMAGHVLRPPPMAIVALAVSLVCGLAAFSRMRGTHWAAFRAYCSSPEVIPKAPGKG